MHGDRRAPSTIRDADPQQEGIRLMVDRHSRRRRVAIGLALVLLTLLVVGGGVFRVAAFSRGNYLASAPGGILRA